MSRRREPTRTPHRCSLKRRRFEEIAQQYDSTEEYDLDTGHVQAIVFSDALLSDRGRMEELLKYLEQDRALGHSAYLFHAEKPEDIMEQNGKTGGVCR